MTFPGRLSVLIRSGALLLLLVGGGAAFFAMETRRPLDELLRSGAVIVQGEQGEPRWIQLKGPTFDDRHLENVAKLDTLTSVFLEESGVTPQGLLRLKRLPQLHVLDVTRTPRAVHGVQAIGQLSDLKELSLHGCQWVNDGDLAHLAGLSRLRILILSETSVTDAGLDALAALQNLQTLNVDGCSVTAEGLRRLAALPRLEALSVQRVPLSIGERDGLRQLLDGAVLHDCGSLTDLHPPLGPNIHLNYNAHCEVTGVEFRDTTADVDLLRTMGDLHQLHSLAFHNTDIDDLRLSSLPNLPALTRLDIYRGRITDLGVAQLARFPLLTHVYLRDVPIHGGGLEHLRSLADLRDLWVESEQLTPEAVQFISEMSTLRRLELFGRLEAPSLACLSRIPHLDSLWIGSPNITEADLFEMGFATRIRHVRFVPKSRSEIGREVPEAAPTAAARYLPGKELSIVSEGRNKEPFSRNTVP